MLRFALRSAFVQRPLTRTVVTKAPAIENGQKIFTSNGHLHGADNPVRSPAPIASISYSCSARYGQYAAPLPSPREAHPNGCPHSSSSQNGRFFRHLCFTSSVTNVLPRLNKRGERGTLSLLPAS